MNKIKYYVFVYIFAILLLFCIPSIFVKGNIYSQEEFNKIINQEDNFEEIKEFVETTTLKVLKNETGEIVDMGLEEYIKGVVCAEMPASYEIEALKAQAVAARTYAIRKIEEHKKNVNNIHPQADVCDDSTHCQAYTDAEQKIEQWKNTDEDGEKLWKKIEDAVMSTGGEIITYNSEPIKAFFHANSGGKTENVELVWGGSEIPYLKSVETMGENNYKQYSSSVNLTKEQINEIMKDKYSYFEIDYSKEDSILIKELTDSGRVQKIKIGNVTISGTDARTMFGLKSTMFNFKINDDNVVFSVVGYGHGVGMSQTGANQLAINGYDYKEILHHYYTDVEIINME